MEKSSKRKNVLLIICLVCMVSCLCASTKPNIIMINVNDTNDFVGFLDGQYSDQSKTPNMNKLADKGVNFVNAHCVTPSCTPSRHGLFYGLYPFNTGLYRYNFNIYKTMSSLKSKYPEFASLNETLKLNGYKTIGIGSNHGNLKKELSKENIEREWDEYLGYTGLKENLHPEKSHYFKQHKDGFGAALNAEEEFGAYQHASKAIDILKKSHEKPFFLALAFNEAHTPFYSPEKYYDRFNDFKFMGIDENDLDDIGLVGKKLVRNGQDHQRIGSAGKWAMAIRSYLAVLAFVDAQVGRVIDALEESQYRNNTIVILWSDHGNNLGRKQKLSKFTLWEASTRVPFVIWDTRHKERNGCCFESVSLVDVYPTLMEMIGLPKLDHLDGLSLIPWLDDCKKERHVPAITMMGRGNYAIRNKDWRYIRYFTGEEELYHTSKDKNEVNNLILEKAYKSKVEELSQFIPENEMPINRVGLGNMRFYDADYADDIKE